MLGRYLPFCDDVGIVAYDYVCPKCRHITPCTDCEQGCEACGFKEPYVDPDEWYDEAIKEGHKF